MVAKPSFIETALKPVRLSRWSHLAWLLPLSLLGLFFLGIILPQSGGGILQERDLATMQACRTIALAEFQYANDHDSKYPTGASSTEVFQKLIDGNYISDPSIFFVPMPGKTKAGLPRLTPQNVCYDVTADVDASSPDGLPLVFLTGFRIEYKPGGRAISLVKPFPQIEQPHPRGWFANVFLRFSPLEGLPVCYKSNNVAFRSTPSGSDCNHGLIQGPSVSAPGPEIDANGFGVVPNVIGGDFPAHDRAYWQLTPNGVLAGSR